MWENHAELHSRIVSILGEDLKCDRSLIDIRVGTRFVDADIIECYNRYPRNFAEKGNDCLRFYIYFEPTTSSIEMADQDGDESGQIILIDENNIHFVFGRWIYKFGAEKIYFHRFQAYKFARLAYINFNNDPSYPLL